MKQQSKQLSLTPSVFARFLVVFLFLIGANVAVSCSKNTSESTDAEAMNNPKDYYRNFVFLPGEKGIPYLPGERISEGELASLKTYYVVIYDGKNRLIKFVKYLDGNEALVQTIEYDGEAVKQVVVCDETGERLFERSNIDPSKLKFFMRR